MNRNLILGILVLVIILSVWAFTQRDSSRSFQENDISVKESATEIKISGNLNSDACIFDSYTKNTLNSKEYRGKILVVNAWATWCPSCAKELQDLATLKEAFTNEIEIIAVNRAEPCKVAQEYINSKNFASDITFLLDEEDLFYKSIGGFSMPETQFIDKKGNIRAHIRAPISLEQMSSEVLKILK